MNWNRYFLFSRICPSFAVIPLVLIYHCLLGAQAEVCPESSDVAAKLLSSPLNSKHRKSCPDFKDDVDQFSCCPSSITPGTFYCCTAEKKEEIDAELAAEARRVFIRNNLALIVIGSILAFVAAVIIVSFFCKRIRMCPLYRGKSVATPPSQNLSHYRPVDTIPPKPPAVYEAPPPYDYSNGFNHYDETQREHDWNCLIENETNDMRISGRDI
uniref:Uncharacterized protein n=1 Tax=Panagrolaimus sp. JU765 TaxID=591449 RepID=A0AC34PUM0_9BILA